MKKTADETSATILNDAGVSESRRSLAIGLLGAFGVGSLLKGCAPGQRPQENDGPYDPEPDATGLAAVVQGLSGTSLGWVDTVLGAAPPATRTGDLATNDPSTLNGATVVIAKGCVTPGDGGGGIFYWDASSTATDDGGTTIASTSIGTGRWKRLYTGAIDVRWFGATGTGGDDTAAIQAACALALNGGVGNTVYFPACSSSYLITDLITLGTNVSAYGDGWRASVIRQTGAFFAIKMSTGSKVSNLRVEGNATATGGIDISSTGFVSIENVDIENFNGTGAIALKVHESYRALIEQVYVYNCYIGVDFAGYVTAFHWLKGELHLCEHRTINAPSASGAESIDVIFTQVTMESMRGLSPIYLAMFGQVLFEMCGFEDCCGAGADPRMIWVVNPCCLYMRNCQVSAFNSSAFKYTGTAHYVYMGNDAPQAMISGCRFIHNNAISGYTLELIRTLGHGQISIADTWLEGTSITTDVQAERIFQDGIDVTYGSPSLSIVNCRARNKFITRRPPSEVGRDPTGATNDAVVSTVTGTGTLATTTLWTKTFPSGSFATGYGFKIRAWGRRTGAVGEKLAQIKLAAGGDTTLAMTAAAITAVSWESEVTVLFTNYTAQSVLITSRDGTALATSATQQYKDTSADDLTVSVMLTITTLAETMTLDGLILERF